jgi:hypothetical protein
MIFTLEMMQPALDLVERCEGLEQNPEHHPEGCVFNHSMQVVNLAFRETIDTDLILAALFHDVGKYGQSHGHEKLSAEWLEPYCSVKTLWLIGQHMRIWYYLLGTMKKLSKCQGLVRHPWFPELVQLARWDQAGRSPDKHPQYDRQILIERLNVAGAKHFRRKNGQR